MASIERALNAISWRLSALQGHSVKEERVSLATGKPHFNRNVLIHIKAVFWLAINDKISCSLKMFSVPVIEVSQSKWSHPREERKSYCMAHIRLKRCASSEYHIFYRWHLIFVFCVSSHWAQPDVYRFTIHHQGMSQDPRYHWACRY